MNIIKSIVDYIKTPNSSGAVMIEGPWGIGKSYYWRNVIVPEITSIINPETGNSYKCLYLSLNELPSVDALQKQIALVKWGLSNPKSSKMKKFLSSTLLGAMANISNFKFMGWSKNIFSGVKLADYLDLSDYVLCFDDFERNKIQTEILGFINTYFVETDRVKTVIIGYEKEIPPNDKYLIVKEKVIYRTIAFPDGVTRLKDLLDIYKADRPLHSLYLSQEAYMETIIREYKIKNLRTVLFTLDILRTVFNHPAHTPFKNELKQSIVLFTLLISIEFKAGRRVAAQYNDYDDLPDIVDPVYIVNRMTNRLIERNRTNRNEPINEKPSYTEEFYNRFNVSEHKEFFFFKAIYNYILSGNFNPELFNSDLLEYEKFIKNRDVHDTPQYNAYQVLFHGFTQDSDDIINSAWSDFLTYAANGEYNFYEYGRQYETLKFLINSQIVSADIQEIRVIMVNGLNKAIAEYSGPNNPIDERTWERLQTDDTEMNNIIKQKLDTLDVQNEDQEFNEFFKIIEGNIKDYARHYDYYNPFKNASAEMIYARIISLEIPGLKKFTRHLDDLMKVDNIEYHFKVYEQKMAALRNLISNHENELEIGLKKYHTRVIFNILNNALNKISGTHSG